MARKAGGTSGQGHPWQRPKNGFQASVDTRWKTASSKAHGSRDQAALLAYNGADAPSAAEDLSADAGHPAEQDGTSATAYKY